MRSVQPSGYGCILEVAKRERSVLECLANLPLVHSKLDGCTAAVFAISFIT